MKKNVSGNGKNLASPNWGQIPYAASAAVKELALEGSDIQDDVLQRVWAQRAAQLAQVPDSDDKGVCLDIVSLRLGNELYGFAAQHVFRIRPAAQLTYVPCVPPWISGVTNERGAILAVLDLQRFFGITVTRDDGDSLLPSYLVIIEVLETRLAVLADEVLDVVSVPLSLIQVIPNAIRGISPEYISGVVDCNATARFESSREKRLVVLDLETLIGDKRLIVNKEIM